MNFDEGMQARRHKANVWVGILAFLRLHLLRIHRVAHNEYNSFWVDIVFKRYDVMAMGPCDRTQWGTLRCASQAWK